MPDGSVDRFRYPGRDHPPHVGGTPLQEVPMSRAWNASTDPYPRRGRRPGPESYPLLLQAAVGRLRAGDVQPALLLLHEAYRQWQETPDADPGYRYDGVKIMALGGECLYRLGRPAEAQARWLDALDLSPDATTLGRLVRTMLRCGAAAESTVVQAAARRRGLDGSGHPDAPAAGSARPPWCPTPSPMDSPVAAPGVAVLADVANLDMVCRDQYGWDRRVDYRRLLRLAEQHGLLRARVAFVPDIPETLAVRQHLLQAGFALDLKQPKRSHGRLVADTDAAMAAAAVRWAGEEGVRRVELWTGDGDFLRVREIVHQARPRVVVAFRSFIAGTAAGIRRLVEWSAIGPECLQGSRLPASRCAVPPLL